MSRIRRLGVATSLAAILIGVIAAPALAKIPYFSVTITPSSPSPGEPITVVVQLWDDPAHTIPASWAPPAEDMDRIFAFVSGDQQVAVDLTLGQDGSYRGSATLAAGSWTLVPFPDAGPLNDPMPGFQGPIAISVASSEISWLPLGTVASAAALAALVVIAAIVGFARRRAAMIEEAPQLG
jgi:hypothetical protein